MYTHRDRLVVIALAVVGVLALYYTRQVWSQDRSLQPKSSVEISLVTAESWAGSLPLKALTPFGQVKNMRSLIKAPNVPDDALTGRTEFNEDGVGMVVLPPNYVSIVAKLAISVRSKTSVRASELRIVDAQKKTHLGTLWDDGLHAWVCSDAEYEPGQYEEYVIFILPLSAERGDKELWLKDQRLASLRDVRMRSDTPQVNAKALAARIIKQGPLGASVMIQDGKLIDVGAFMTVSGNRMTIVEPKKD